MGNTYKVQVLHFSNILEIEGARTTRDFEALLDAINWKLLHGQGAA